MSVNGLETLAKQRGQARLPNPETGSLELLILY
jgi:hypothetical protein